jgi:hypothetical protein
LREEDPGLNGIDLSISSVGHALGASDERMRREGGGVEAAPSSIVANYFLKSHGGAHALQCACSLLATLSGLGAIVFQNQLRGTLLQRTMIFAMIKHVSGLIAAAALAAKAIPKVGLSQARSWMEKIVLDPVSQYVFYTALILLWLPSKQRLDSCWWWKMKWIPPLLVGPVLVREIISNLLVVSDILVLCSVGDESDSIKSILKVAQSTINAAMSLVVTPKVWRSADPAQRQAILAKLVSKSSLVMEVFVGLLLCVDFLWTFGSFAFSSLPQRPPMRETIKQLICVRLYLHFLWVRRRKITKLAVKVRGGAAHVPFWFLDVLLDPAGSMGLHHEKSKDDPSTLTWKDYIPVALGMDE